MPKFMFAFMFVKHFNKKNVFFFIVKYFTETIMLFFYRNSSFVRFGDIAWNSLELVQEIIDVTTHTRYC